MNNSQKAGLILNVIQFVIGAVVAVVSATLGVGGR